MKTEDKRRAKRYRLRRLMLLVVLASLVPYAGAAKRVTVAQLEQALTAAHAAHKPDADIARQIGGFELSERLTEATLNRLSAYLDAGSQAALALQLLADQSAFLDPPASELPSTAAPDDAAQQRMIEAARTYVAKTVPQLPNLFAIRTTNRYDDRPQEIKKGGWPVRAGLHLVSTSSREISVFDEQTNESTTAASARWQEQSGLISEGEFGSTLSMILTDTVKGKVNWSHWEQTSAGPVAVFHYSVPSSASHFEVINSLQRQASLEGTSTPTVGSRQGSGIDCKIERRRLQHIDLSHQARLSRFALGGSGHRDHSTHHHGGRHERQHPVQEGRDPGAVWPGSDRRERVHLPGAQPGSLDGGQRRQSRPSHPHAGRCADRMVEREPVHGLSSLRRHDEDRQGYGDAATTRFQRQQPAVLQEVSPPADSNVTSKQKEEIPDEIKRRRLCPISLLRRLTFLPCTSSRNKRRILSNTPARIVVNVNRAFVPVVVRDKQGHAVGDLKKEDFQVFDNGKPQVISGFTVEKREVTESAPGETPHR